MEGYENGVSVVTFPDGKKEERNYEGGALNGPALVVGPKGNGNKSIHTRLNHFICQVYCR